MVKRNRAVAQVEVYKTVQQKNLGNFTCQPAWGAPKMGMVLPTDKDWSLQHFLGQRQQKQLTCQAMVVPLFRKFLN